MLVTINGTTKHAAPVAPHNVVVPAKKDAMNAWAQLKKRLKNDEAVALLDRYLLTR
jgi:hypothetical protein